MSYSSVYRAAILCLLLATQACTEKYIYRPISARPHFFQTKGDYDLHLNASGGTEIGGSYAFSRYLAAGVTYSAGQVSVTSDPIFNALGNPTGSTQTDLTSFRDLEGNVTVFRTIAEKITIEATAGFSAPSYRFIKIVEGPDGSQVSREVQSSENRYNRAYIQPAIGRNGKFLDAGFALRVQAINYAGNVQNDLLVEPIVSFRAGYNRWKGMLQVGATYDYKNSTLAEDYDYFPIHLAIGFNYVVTPQTGRRTN